MFLIFLLVLILVIVFIIAAYPRAQQSWKKSPKNFYPHKPPVFATALRSQKEDIIIPQLAVLTTPTTVDFVLPDESVVVTKSATYTVSYTVQLKWLQEATASVKITTNDGNLLDLIGSQIQETVAIAGVVSVSHTFLASLKKGMILSLVVQASLVDSVVIPASDDAAVLFTPTTLASLTIVEI